MYFILYSIFTSIATSFMLPSLYRSTSRLKSLTNVNLIRSNYQLNLSMKLNCGIVGLPNVGKSTLFNALVGSQAAQAANFPFCTIGETIRITSNFLILLLIQLLQLSATTINTIEPNVGLVNVPDQRLDQLGVINKSVKVVPAVVSTHPTLAR